MRQSPRTLDKLTGVITGDGGPYAAANKAIDRHDRRYHPAPHHSKLVVNAAFAFSHFLYDTNKYQRSRRAAEAA